MGQVLFHALALFSSSGFNRRPHRRKFSIAHDGRDLELNAKAFDPRAEVRPHLADVAGYGNRNTTAAHRLADEVLQFKSVETIARCSGIDVLGKPGQDSHAPSKVGKDQTIK